MRLLDFRLARGAAIRRAVLAGVLLLLFTLVGFFKLSAPTSIPSRVAFSDAGSVADHTVLDQQLLDAIRDGESVQVQALLEQGADPNVRDDTGETALMRGALFADVEAMRVLVAHGAKASARGGNGASPLLRAVHDLGKARLLLERGAPVNDMVMVAAARVPGCRELLDLLFAHGGNARAAVHGYTPLMASAGNGDLGAVKCLLDHGADAKAQMSNGYTGLIGAAIAGDAQVVALLLERGADPNIVCKTDTGILQTPASVAAVMGRAECLRLLMAAGADVNIQGGPFEQNALLGAATSSSKETVRLLLARADVRATDWSGRTALDWAARSGQTDIVKVLRAAGASPSGFEARPSEPVAPRNPADPGSARRAVAAALPLLQQSGQTITRTRNCVSCHQHALVAMTVGLARKHRFKIDETIASEERAYILQDIARRVRPLLLGTGIDSTLSAQVLAGLAAEDVPASRTTDALVHYLVLRQRTDGHWQGENNRPPDDASDFHFTALAVRGLRAYAPKGRSREVAARIGRARRWLQGAEPTDTTDRVFQLLGLGWAQADRETVARAVTHLLREQRADGGWSQLPTLASDAYATGLALCALHEGGGVAVDHGAYRRGVEFLLRTQMADGSWSVASRSFPVVEYSKSGFPHGRSQFISAAATCWAAMALIPATDSKEDPQIVQRKTAK
jgi:ankyrin repeat protein